MTVDPPEVSATVVAEVARRPWPSNTTFEALSVVEPSYVWDVPTLLEGLQDAAAEAAQRAADQLRAAGLSATSYVMTGDPKAAIVDRAREIPADLVVVGSRGASGFARMLLGSVATAVARFAPCSVEIVRAAPSDEPRPTAMKILLATDGSEYSLIAARSVAERPWPPGTSVRVLSVAELHIPLLKMPYFSHTAMENLRADAMRKAEEAEMAAEQIFADAGIEESGTVAVPSATVKEIILQNAEEWAADLIVCGSHGRKGVSRFLLGSVSEVIASHAKCSVEIIRKLHS